MGIFSKKKKDIEKDKEATVASAPAASVPKRGDATSYRVIFGPHVTEKAGVGNADRKYVFRIAKDAGKTAVKQAVETMYNVDVANVHVLHMPSKVRQVGRHAGVKSGYKKAVVTLKKGSKIDIVA